MIWVAQSCRKMIDCMGSVIFLWECFCNRLSYFKAQAMEPDYLGLNPGSTTCCSVSMGKLLNLSVPQFLHL